MTKNYTMEQINNFLYDALNDEDLSAQEIYETIIETVAEHTEYLQLQYEKSQQVFDLLKGTAKPWDKFIEDNDQKESNFPNEDDCMPPWGHSDLEYASKHPEENKVKSWVLPVDEDGVIILPEDLLEQTGWQEGDTLVYEISDGGVIVRKKDLRTYDDMIDAGYTMTDDGFWIMDMDAF
jgi:bifunctional DNA-binding transcriptional regulator/antitoxin component of YhaV-PrlF toxin-antitoxin module